jgi:GNAT superfamily N-acetyltransferase
MTTRDIALGMKLVSTAGWNQVESDWLMLLDSGQDGCFVAAWEGIDAGTLTTVFYPPYVGWIGMVLVDPAYRMRGIGTSLVKAALAAACSVPSLWLDATPQGQGVYSKLGFDDEFTLRRWLRQPAQAPFQALVRCNTLTQDDFPGVVQLDTSTFGADRERVLLKLSHDHSGMAFSVEKDGKLTGFCLGRRGRLFDQVGPLVAESEEIAQQLLLWTLAQNPARPVLLDVPDYSQSWQIWLDELGFRAQRSFTRMRAGDRLLQTRLDHYFAAAGPELG